MILPISDNRKLSASFIVDIIKKNHSMSSY